MRQRQKSGPVLLLKYIILILFFITCIYPLLWLIINSFKTNEDLFANTWGLPVKWVLENYKHAIIDGNIGRYFLNSVFVSVTSVVLTLILSLMAAYGLIRLKWRHSKLVLGIFLLGMMIPAYGSIIPLYNIFNKIGILNSYIAVIIPHVTFALPMGIFIMTGFFAGLPTELEEASIIDGCGIMKAFRKVIVPVVMPGIVTVAVISFINIWNDLLFSQIFLSDQKKMPLTVGLTQFQGIYSTDYVGMIAAIVITVIPIIIVYIILHEKIIEGTVSGAAKGEGERMKLLIADDEDVIREGLLKLEWKNSGVTDVRSVDNGIDALKAFSLWKPDVMLTDIRMAGLDGLQLAETIQSGGNECRIIILSGYGTFEYARRAIHSGVFEFLVKPSSPQEILEAVKRAVSDLSKADAGESYHTVSVEKEKIFNQEKGQNNIGAVLEYIEKNYMNEITLQSVSEYMHFSPAYLSKLIKKETNFNFIKILCIARMLKAAELLATTNLKVYEICQRVGMGDQRYFGQLFLKTFGNTPIEYRKKNRKAAGTSLIDFIKQTE